jgi:hypothetical protein
MSLRQVDQLAAPLGLHPRILYHCRRQLNFNPDDLVFSRWHELVGEHGADAVDAFYRPLFAQATEAKADKDEQPNTQESSEQAISDGADSESELVAAARVALTDHSGFLAVPPKPEFAFDDPTLVEYYRLMEDARITESNAPDVRSAMGVCDGEVLTSLPIHIRGSHLSLGDPVERNVPTVLRDALPLIEFPEDQSGRLQLARWMTDPDHPLAARVYVNRLWRWHFGQGIVQTTENFGALGDRPSHPRLLDWLASTLLENGWSTKRLHRLIVHSNTYQQSSSHTLESLAADIDPANELLWKFPQLRLEAEQIHDSILAVCGELDPTLCGKTVPLRNRQFVFNHTSVDHTKYDSHRRAIYLPVIRNNLYATFEQFDFPDPTMPTGNRGSTIVAPQALLIMNSEMVLDAAKQLARQLLSVSQSEESRIEVAFQRILGRSPTRRDLQRSSGLIDELTSTHHLDPHLAWSMLCQGLIACNEFIYLQ